MSILATEPADVSERADDRAAPSETAPYSTQGSRLWRSVVFPWKYLAAVLLCQSLLTGVLVVGWVYRLMQRSALKSWYRQSGAARAGISFQEFVAEDADTRGHAAWPNFMLDQRANRTANKRLAARGAGPGMMRRFLRGAFGSLWQNAKIGLAGVFNTWVVTLPACALWAFSWTTGWNISFYKAYEQSYIGPLTGWVGILLLMVAMLYVPLAQARQAVTGDWRRFYDFRVVRQVVRRRLLACLGLAALFAALAAPILVIKSAPLFFTEVPEIAATYENMTDAEIVEILEGYYFWATIGILPFYVMLRLLAAKIYAGGLLSAVQHGYVPIDRLAPLESTALDRLGLLHVEAEEVRPMTVGRAIGHGAGWTGSRLARISITTATLGVWFVFTAQIFVAQFFNYTGLHGWLNHPLVHLPVLKYVPQALLGG